MDLSASNSYFRAKTISKVAIIKTKSATIAFFSLPPFLFLTLSFFPPFPSLLWFWSFSALRNICPLTPFHRMTFKKIPLGIYSCT